MNIEPNITVAVLVALLAASACTPARPQKSQATERAKPTQVMLTSTVPAVAAKLIDEEKPEPPDADRVEASPSFEPELESLDGLTIQRLVTTPKIKRREPLAASSVFGAHDEKVYAFVEVRNDAEEDKTLRVHFIGPEGQVSGGIELRIPASTPRWRTWAYTRNATKPGLWRVEIRSEDGTLVGALPFEVEHGC